MESNYLINCKIANLQILQPNIRLIGVIITRQDARSINIKKSSEKKSVLNFTLRDSEIDFINVAIWGSDTYIEALSEQFTIGCIIEIKKPQIRLKSQNGAKNSSYANNEYDTESMFKPWTPSQYELVVYEKAGAISLVDISEPIPFDYDNLMSVPIREHNDYYKLQDIIINEKNLDQQLVNLLFAVRKVNDPQELKTKHDKIIKKMDVIVFDETYAAFKFTIWDNELIRHAMSWTPKSQVVFAVDVRVTFDPYKKTMVASTTSKTIFILNPSTNQGFNLYNYAKNCNIDTDYDLNTQFEEFERESVKYKIKQLNDALTRNDLNDDFIMIDAFISQFDIDCNPTKIISYKCIECESFINVTTKTCTNNECVLMGKKMDNFKYVYDTSMNLTDETGTIARIKATSKCIETLFETKPKEFLSLTVNQITELKWKVLLERWKILIKATLNPNYEDNELKTNIYLKIVNIQPAI